MDLINILWLFIILASLQPAQAREVARILATDTWTHDHPLQPRELKALGLPVEGASGLRGVHTLAPGATGETPQELTYFTGLLAADCPGRASLYRPGCSRERLRGAERFCSRIL
jgi:hypothetical protein